VSLITLKVTSESDSVSQNTCKIKTLLKTARIVRYFDRSEKQTYGYVENVSFWDLGSE